jgi:predicted esterase
VDYLVLWAGGLPDDVLFGHRKKYFQEMQSHYFVGDKDPYISKKVLEDRVSLLDSVGLKAEMHTYEGDHRVDEKVLKSWAKQLS